MAAIAASGIRSPVTIADSVGSPERSLSSCSSAASPSRIASPLLGLKMPAADFIRASIDEVMRRADVLAVTTQARIVCVAGRVLVDVESRAYSLISLGGSSSIKVPVTEQNLLADMTPSELWDAARALDLRAGGYLNDDLVPELKKIVGIDLLSNEEYEALQRKFDKHRVRLKECGDTTYCIKDRERNFALYAFPFHIPDIDDEEGIECLHCDRPDSYLIYTLAKQRPGKGAVAIEVDKPFFSGRVRIEPGYREYRIHYPGDSVIEGIDVPRDSALGEKLAKLFDKPKT